MLQELEQENMGKKHILLRLSKERGIGDIAEEKHTAVDEGVQYE